MFYDHQQIEKKWQNFWQKNQTFKTDSKSKKPKFYVLDMFPYPSGAGLHVGHPLGYIASDIYARYKRHQNFNVLHPVGYDSFGLPAEQYAIETGQHPAITTKVNIEGGKDTHGHKIQGYENQLRQLGFSFDWSREIRTSEPSYYQFTQWIFIEMFHSWYNQATDKAEPIESLISYFQNQGTEGLLAVETKKIEFSAQDWKGFSENQKQEILLNYRLAFRAETSVNWCPALGTVLANDEVKEGKSERGGHPVFQKTMMQWSMRITAYSERLLQGLSTLDWPQALKDSQEYWIGKSQGAELQFEVLNRESTPLKVFTTRIDTLFGVTFMVLAPEHPLVKEICMPDYLTQVENYLRASSLRSERDRMADVKTVSGVFTGGFAVHPFSGKPIAIYVSDYVLMGYGTGAVMGVPAHDDRDHRFAKHFNIEIIEVIKGGKDVQNEPYSTKDGELVNSDIYSGFSVKEATKELMKQVTESNIGKKITHYKQRDAIFSRQRYWGEPVPIYFKNQLPYTLPQSALPLHLPEVEDYKPTEMGDPPLANASCFAWDEANQKVVDVALIDHKTIFPLELSTMPGWAGSSWYFLRYMDVDNKNHFASRELTDYWGQVDLYIGGSEHATGHLLYSRFWNMFLNDRNYISQKEPFQKLINQGMILGMSALIHRVEGTNKFVSKALAPRYKTTKIHIDISLLKATTDEVDLEQLKQWRSEFSTAEFICEEGVLIATREVEKMSKSKYNVVNPDDICQEYGADCLRMYEMFLGPLEQSKPWNTQGLSGVYGFLKKFWNLYFNPDDVFEVSDERPSNEEYKVLHHLIKKVNYDIQNFSFNTSVSSFMIAVNDLQKLKCNKKAILEELAVLISPYAPHICEEIWSLLGHKTSIEYRSFPKLEEHYLLESEIDYPISVNGKMKFKMTLPAHLNVAEIEEIIRKDERYRALVGDYEPKKLIIVPKKIVNIVL